MEGRGWAGWSGVKGGIWDNYNSIINKYIKKLKTGKNIYPIYFFDHFFFSHIFSWNKAGSVLTLRIYKLFLQVFYSVCTL